MGKHTPGPWIAVGAWVEHPDDDVADICTCNPNDVDQGSFSRPYKEMCANAQLCAAAPDLLELLKEHANYMGTRHELSSDEEKIWQRDLAERINAAIAKAEGR